MSGKSIADQEWLCIEDAAVYAGRVSPEIVRRAIASGELEAHAKPLTRGRKPGAAREYLLCRVSKTDIDKWIRGFWPRVGEE